MLIIHRVSLLAVIAVLPIPILSGAVYARGAGGSAHGAIAAPASGAARPAYTGPTMAQARSGGGRSSSPASSASRPGSGGISSGPPTSPSAPSAPAPSSQIGAPASQPSAIAPLSPQLPTQFSTGGSTGASNLALSPGSSSGSPSESVPSAPGGGGKSLADCMGFWDKGTHMSKTEWRSACQRTLQEYRTVR
jgi:hypothetical protein